MSDSRALKIRVLGLKEVLEFQGISHRSLLLHGIDMAKFNDIQQIDEEEFDQRMKQHRQSQNSEDESLLSSSGCPLSSFCDLTTSDAILQTSSDGTPFFHECNSYPHKRQKTQATSEILTSEQNILTSALDSD